MDGHHVPTQDLLQGPPSEDLLETKIPEGALVPPPPSVAQPQQPPEQREGAPSAPPSSSSSAATMTRAIIDDEEASGASGELREYTGQFEGPEKTLEVVFRRAIDGSPVEIEAVRGGNGGVSGDVGGGEQPWQRIGLRRLSRPDLDRVCARARCTILSSVSNKYLDAYLLSESSLFVYPYMLVLKTCGTTTLLRCLAVLIELGRRVGLELDWVGYSRKNFNFPGDQAFPHQSFHQELEYLYSHRNLCERLDGNGYTLGPVTGDHWFVFVADQTIRSKLCDLDTDRVLNIMMFDIDPSVAELFQYSSYPSKISPDETDEEATRRISSAQTDASGIRDLCPGASIDARAFEPCGYSMNAILFRSYYTIHVTPESGSSYASFETNQRVASYESLIHNVVRTFRPGRFVMTLMADEAGLVQMKENPLSAGGRSAGPAASSMRIVVPCVPPPKTADAALATNPPAAAPASGRKMLYKRTTLASIKVEEDCCCMMGNFILEDGPGLYSDDEFDARTLKARGRGMSVS
mmetsp:Transcript_38567/g.71277  ORF Transcript_38567/g.71277 Transcript_38567/m.71277 type:complete len:521 (-) Transcript_38567:553-2115(-)